MSEIEENILEQELSLEAIKKRAAIGVFALTARTFLIQVVTLVSTFLLTVYLDPKEFGTFFLTSAVINFFAFFSDIGLAGALIQKKEKLTAEDLKTTFTIQQLLVFLLMIVIFLLTPVLKNFYHFSNDATYLLWALDFSLLLSSLKTIPSVLLERKLNFNRLVIPQIIETILFYLVTVYLAWHNFGITSFTVAVLVRGFAGLIAVYILSPWLPGYAFSKNSLKQLFKFGLPYQANALMALIKDDGMTAVLGGVLGTGGIGLLGWAQKWGAAPLRFFMDQIIKVTFPAYARMQDQKQELSKVVSKSIFFICLITFPTLVTLVLAAPVLVDVIPKYGKWKPALLPLDLLALSAALAAITTPLTNMLNAIGKITITFKLMLMWTILTWIFIPILAYYYGVNGAAWGFFIVGLTSLLAIKIAAKYISLDFRNAIGRPTFLSVCLICILLIAKNFFPHTLIGVIAFILAAVLIYILLCLIFIREDLIQDLKLLKR